MQTHSVTTDGLGLVLDAYEQQVLHDLLARVVEQGTGNPLFTDHSES